MRAVLALPLDEQRERLLPLYRAAYDAYGRDWEFNTAAIGPDYTLVVAGSRPLPEFDHVHGREGYIQAHRRVLEFLDIERVEVDDVRPLGGGRVVAFTRFIIRVGDATIDQQALDHHEFEDGLLRRQTVWFDREEGLRDLGL